METEIISAIKKGYFQQVRLLVKSRLSVNSRDSYHRTALVYCSLVDDESWGVGLARTLLEAGATVYLVDRAGLGPLHYACILGKASLLRIYLGAADFDVNLADYLGNTALHYAAATGFVEAVETLLATCARYGYRIDALNRIGDAPMDMAVKNGHTRCAELIEDAKRTLRERRILMRAVSVPSLTSPSTDRKCGDLEISVRRSHKLRNGSATGSTDSNTGLDSGISGTRGATTGTSDISGSTSTTSTGSRPKSGLVSGVTPIGRTNRKSWSASLKADGDATRRPFEAISLADERSTTLRGYELVIRKLRSLRRICAAPAKDPRSNPAKILGQNPSNIFAASQSHQMAPASSTSGGSWRSTMNGLYDSFYFQFSTTYRSPVKIDVTAAADDLCRQNETVLDAGDFRRRQFVRKTSAFKRTSVVPFTGSGDQQPRRRKTSAVFMPRPQRRQSQQTSVSGSSGDRLLPSL